MRSDIPQEQLEKVQPLVERFLSAFQQLELEIPLETESASDYVLEPESPAPPPGDRL